VSKHTPGPWRVVTNGNTVKSHAIPGVCASISLKTDNAALIVAAVNACFAINPENPMAVAEGLGELVAATKFLVEDASVWECDATNHSDLSDRVWAALTALWRQPDEHKEART
jgi:hypothetical protein